MENIDVWGINIFQINDLTNNRPLTAVVFTIFQVISLLLFISFNFYIHVVIFDCLET
jgi:hypothetical protein